MANKLKQNRQIFLDQYLNTNHNFLVIYNHSLVDYKNDPYLVSFKLLLDALADKRLLRKALDDAPKLNLSDIDTNLKLIFLEMWYLVSLNDSKIKKACALLDLAISLIDSDTALVIKQSILFAKIDLDGSLPLKYKKIEQVIFENFSMTNRFSSYFLEYVIVSSRIGYANNLNDKCREVIAMSSDRSNLFYCRLGLFIQSVETGQLEQAVSIREDLLRDEIISEADYLRINFGYWDCLLDLFLGLEIDEDKFATKTNNNELRNILKVHMHLQNNENQLALDLSKKVFDFLSKNHFSNFAEYTSLRSELANLNIEAAKRILTELGNKRLHYLDGFFLARIYLLEHKRDEANVLYHKTLKECIKFNAESRLDLELNFASEIRLIDLKYITKASSIKSSTIKKNIIKNEKQFSEKPQISLIGKHQSTLKLLKEIKDFSNVDIPVLIIGETGTGKEVVANMLHHQSKRASKPFIPINCGAISESLLYSELFGHVAGSFTNATSSRKGIFETAGKGTVFLDEIGEISEKIQISLLRVLEADEYRPVGSSQAISLNCRIIAATNAPLKQLVAEKKFRSDLYFRLKRLEINIPPLRDRGLDTILLVNHYLKLNRIDQKTPKISDDLYAALLAYSWPGNVRELKNEIEKLVILNSSKLFYELDDCDFLKNQEQPQMKFPNKMADVNEKENSELNIERFLKQGSGQIRRIRRIKELFRKYEILTRKEIAQIEEISLITAGLDLKNLCELGFIKVVKPNNSKKAQYYQYIQS